MPEFDHVLLAAAAAALLAGGLVKGIIGIGTPLVVIPVLTIFVDVKLAVQLMALPLFLSNVFQGFRGRDTLAVIGRLAAATIGLAGGIVAGVMLAGKFPVAVLGVQSPAGDTLLLSLAACLPLLIGMVAGARIRGMLPQAALRLFVLAVIFVGGANMILRGI